MTLIEEVLAAWRDAERLLDELPEIDADHETVARAVAELRALYAELTTASTQSRARIRASGAAVARTRALLERARRSIELAESSRDGSQDGSAPGGEAPRDLPLGGG